MKRRLEKRQAILDAAAEAFRDEGYERASMADIGLRSGCSKTTLYGYFASKEALLAELAGQATESGVAAMHEVLAETGAGLDITLGRFAGRYLAFALSPSVCDLRRILAATAGRSGLDPRCRDLGTARIDAGLAGYLRTQMEAGTLRSGDARGAAQQFRALLEASWFDRVLFDCDAEPGPGEAEQDAQSAIKSFLRAWGRPLPGSRGALPPAGAA
jgi:AcrR family transcriptional regulator